MPARRGIGSADGSAGPRQLIWYTGAPPPSTDCPFVFERSSADRPDILDFSHVALPIAPDNPRYRADGGYPDCSHYYWENSPNWLICVDATKTSANADLRYGEVTAPNLQRHLVRRLTYNPDFAAMTGAALAFLAEPEGVVEGGRVLLAPVRSGRLACAKTARAAVVGP